MHRPNICAIRELAIIGHVAVGFGHREFFPYAPSWSELSLGTAVRPLLRSRSGLLHVEHRDNSQVATRCCSGVKAD